MRLGWMERDLEGTRTANTSGHSYTVGGARPGEELHHTWLWHPTFARGEAADPWLEDSRISGFDLTSARHPKRPSLAREVEAWAASVYRAVPHLSLARTGAR